MEICYFKGCVPMQISGAGFNPYSSIARIQKPSVPQEASNVQWEHKKTNSLVFNP